MFGIELLTVESMAVLVGMFNCPAAITPEVGINVRINPVQYNTSKTSNQLRAYRTDTKNPYGNSRHTKLSGLHNGNFNYNMDMSFSISRNTLLKKSCVQINTVNINIDHKATIYIARDNNGNKCRYNSTMQHELKHERIDLQIIQTYKPIFYKAIKSALQKKSQIGPVHSRQTKAAQSQLTSNLQNTLNSIVKHMDNELKRRQQKVDSLREYERLSKACR